MHSFLNDNLLVNINIMVIGFMMLFAALFAKIHLRIKTIESLLRRSPDE